MKKGKFFLAALSCISLLNSLALANGLNLNSLGTRALSMGGAFVGLADDFSAIYWNPAGIAQFDQKYFGVYGTDIIPSGKYRLDIPTGLGGPFTLVDAKSSTKHFLGGLAAYYFPLSEKLVAGLGVFTPSGLGIEWDGSDLANLADGNADLKWSSLIGQVTIAPALAYKINDKVFMGATFNLNYGVFNIAMHAGSTALPIPPYVLDLGQYEEDLSGWGVGATFGILVKPNETFSLGATFKTPTTMKFKGDTSISNFSLLGFNSSSDVERKVRWPMEISGGVAFRPLPNLILTADLQWEQWSVIDIMEAEFKDPFWQIMMAASGDDARPMHWDDKMQIRFGGEYTAGALAFRGGYYYDPSPAPDRTMNILLPNYDFNVVTVGLGYRMNGLQFDFGFEYLVGKKREIPLLKVIVDPDWETAMPGSFEMKIVVPNISVSYRF